VDAGERRVGCARLGSAVGNQVVRRGALRNAQRSLDSERKGRSRRSVDDHVYVGDDRTLERCASDTSQPRDESGDYATRRRNGRVDVAATAAERAAAAATGLAADALVLTHP